jgi:hypothetical protein
MMQICGREEALLVQIDETAGSVDHKELGRYTW